MILIVDDSTTNQVLLEAILHEEGFETVTAFSAREAFKLIEKEKPDLILLDLLMPEVSGFDFLRKIKADSVLSTIPIFVVSAVGSLENRDTCMELGATEFFNKPIDIPNFIKQVKQIV
ncbi:MAG TPA: response regulator [Tenuifilaceae bacterium]|nr:response regulator [Tenuifilaceae bacterium]HPE17146.1 response regulator [Tenuifilaceae bacterium]HPJ45874.1 response regulator [Tenuifilaceae bacterium]HPQ34095.1 response regulator [Tenuifilaceae bacterium]HRX68734.1 response regulator [Tenuifilaceae bacterium]